MNKHIPRVLQPGSVWYCFVLLAFTAAAALLDQYYLAGAELVVTIAVFIISRVRFIRRKHILMDYVQSATDAVGISVHAGTPFPMAVIRLPDNEIIWGNPGFYSITGLSDATRYQTMDSVIPGFSTTWLREGRSELPGDQTINGRRYRVYGNYVRSEDDATTVMLATIFFADMTEMFNIRDEFMRTRPIISVILVDNYDELTNNLSDSAVSQIDAKVNDAISAWTEGLHAICRKIERNRYLLVFESKDLQKLQDGKFSLLDSIRSMAARGISVIFITHRLQEILSVCDKVVIMRDGVVVKDTPASETNVSEITRCMVGRSVDLSSAKREIVDHSGAKNILSIRNLWVDMPGETVRNVTLDVKEGEILGIGGLAGQGKLGIPNGVMGLYEAGGTVEFDGKEIPLNSPRKCLDASLAFVSEDRRGVGLLLDETLEWNVAFPAMQIQNKFLKKIGPVTWRDEKAIHDITQKYIGELMIKCTSSLQKARELSGGNQQKICLAKAFALEPRFLFVSEPTRGIDVGAKALVLDALKRFNRENGVTVVMISSELEELRQTCDRIAIVSGGRIAGILPATDSSEAFGALMVSQVK